MKISKKTLKLGLKSFARLANSAAATGAKKRTKKKKPKTFELDENTQWVLDCLDEMILDVKQMRKDIEEHGKRIAQLEARIDNVNSRVDNVVGDR